MNESTADLIDRLGDLKAKKKYVEQDLKDLEELIKSVEGALIEKLDAEGLTKSASKAGSVSLGESVVPQVENWDEFYTFIWENKFFHMLERRASVTGFRELHEMGRKVPGVLPYTKRRVTFRSV